MSSVRDRIRTCGEETFPTVEAFESGTLDPEAFDHPAHVFIAWKLLERYPLAGATAKFLKALDQLTSVLGLESKYNETISCFYMTLIAERRSGQPGQPWMEFANSNPDLLGPSMDLLEQHYTPERLWSDLARRQFLLPDRVLQAGDSQGI